MHRVVQHRTTFFFINGFLFKKYSDKQSVRGSAREVEALSSFAATSIFHNYVRSGLGLLVLEIECSSHTWYSTSIELVSSTLVLLKLWSPLSLSRTLVEGNRCECNGLLWDFVAHLRQASSLSVCNLGKDVRTRAFL